MDYSTDELKDIEKLRVVGRSSLDIYTECSSALTSTYRKAGRYVRLAALRKVSNQSRQKNCSRYFLPKASGMKIFVNADTQNVKFYNLMRCNLVWTCPVCSAIAAENRRIELNKITSHDGLTFIFCTFTVQHHKNDRLTDLLSVLDGSISKMRSGRSWRDFCSHYGIVGSISSLEIKYGKNGFHPHRHIVFVSKNTSEFLKLNFVDIKGFIFDRYTSFVSLQGGYANQVDIEIYEDSEKDLSYLVKDSQSVWGLDYELTRFDLKNSPGSYDMFQVLDAIAAGQQDFLPVWREFEAAIKGKRKLIISKGLRLFINGFNIQENFVEYLDHVDFLLGLVSYEAWRVIYAKNLISDLLFVCKDGNFDLADNWIFSVSGSHLIRGLDD